MKIEPLFTMRYAFFLFGFKEKCSINVAKRYKYVC